MRLSRATDFCPETVFGPRSWGVNIENSYKCHNNEICSQSCCIWNSKSWFLSMLLRFAHFSWFFNDFYRQTLLYLLDFSTSKSVINLSRPYFEIFPVFEKRELSQGLGWIKSTKPNKNRQTKRYMIYSRHDFAEKAFFNKFYEFVVVMNFFRYAA